LARRRRDGWSASAGSRPNQEEHAIENFQRRKSRAGVNHVITDVQMTSRFIQEIVMPTIDQIVSKKPEWVISGQLEVEPVAEQMPPSRVLSERYAKREPRARGEIEVPLGRPLV
jgi:hypothetical protein